MRTLLVALLVLLPLLAPPAAATHLVTGVDCAGAAAHVARIEARIVTQRAAYNASNSALTAAKNERDDLAEELVDDSEAIDDLTTALEEALAGQGSKLADVMEQTLDDADGVDLADTFYAAYLADYGLTQNEVEAQLDPDDVADLFEDLVGAAEDANAAVVALMEERSAAAEAKRSLDTLGARLRLLAAESTHVRQTCALGGSAPQVPSSEPSLGSAEGPSDSDLLEALFATKNIALLIDGVADDYVAMLEVLDPLLDATPDDNDVEDAVDEALETMEDDELAEPIDRAIDLHIGLLDTLEMTAMTDPAIIEDREDDTATAAERTDALRDGDLTSIVLRTNASLARTAAHAARATIGVDVRFVAPNGTSWPDSVIVVGAGADPGTPLVTLASNGTTKLLPGSYDVYGVDANGRYPLRAGVAVSAAGDVPLGARVRPAAGGVIAPFERWGYVPAGEVILPGTRTWNATNATALGPVGAYDIFVQREGRIERFVASTNFTAGALAEFNLPEVCRTPFDALLLDMDGDGIALTGATTTTQLSARNVTIRWTPRDSDDGFLVIDATSLSAAGYVLSTGGEPVDGLTPGRAGMMLRAPDGSDTKIVDQAALLRALDANKDGQLGSADATWGSLKLWTDANGDGTLSVAEVSALTGVSAIPVALGPSMADALGNLVRRGNFTASGTTRTMSDVFFAEAGRCGAPAAPTTPTLATPTPTPSTPVVPTNGTGVPADLVKGEVCDDANDLYVAGSRVVLDATAARAAGYQIRDEDGAPLEGVVTGDDPVIVTRPDGASYSSEDGWSLIALFDRNADGVITSADPAYGALRAWGDDDGDGRPDATELESLATARVNVLDISCREQEVPTTPTTPTASTQPTPQPTPSPTPGEQEPQGPIPGPGLALVLALGAALAIILGRRR